jgi:hypothetical protein
MTPRTPRRPIVRIGSTATTWIAHDQGSQTHLGATNSSTVTANDRISTDGNFNYTDDDEGNITKKVQLVSGVDDADGAGSGGSTIDFYTYDGQQIVMAFHKGLSGNAALTNRYLWGPESINS